MKSSKKSCFNQFNISHIHLIILMNILSFLYFLVNVQCVNENEVNKQLYSVLCFDRRCTEKISIGRVYRIITPESSDYLNVNLNDSFDVLGLNKDVYLVRKQLEEGFISRESIRIIERFHDPKTEVEISFKNNRIYVIDHPNFIEEELAKKSSTLDRTENTQKEQNEHVNVYTSSQSIEKISNDSNIKSDSNITSDSNIRSDSVKSSLLDDDQTKNLEQTEKETKLKAKIDNNYKKVENLSLDDTLEKLNLISDVNNINATLDEESIKIDNEIEDEFLDEEEDKSTTDTSRSTLNILNDNQHSQYVKMNSIESTSDSSFNQVEPYFCSLPANQTSGMNFYLDILRYILGKFIVDRLPENLVNFLKIKLLISVHLIVFVFIIGVIWFIFYFIALIYQSIDNKTKLKNQVCDLQAQLATLEKQKELIKKQNVQAKNKAHILERNKLDKKIDELSNEKLKLELELIELKERIKILNETNDEIRTQKELLMKKLKEEVLSKSELETNLNEKLKKLQDDYDLMNNYYLDLKKRKQKNDEQIQNLNECLNQLKDELKEKDDKIQCLNRMYKELKRDQIIHKEENSLDKHSSNDVTDKSEKIESNQNSENTSKDQIDDVKKEEEIDLNRLKNDFEKLQKENEELSFTCEEYKLQISKSKEEISKFERFKDKLIKEKEDAEKFTEFSKKYLREKEDELQIQTKLIKDELEETKKLYLNSEKYSAEYWRENQTLKNDLNVLRRDNEQLRRRLNDLMQDEDKSLIQSPPKIPLPPEMPIELLNYLRLAASPTASMTSLSNQSNQQPQSPSNRSQISSHDYYIQQPNYSMINEPSHQHSVTTSPIQQFVYNDNSQSSLNNSLKSNNQFSLNKSSQSNLNMYNFSFVDHQSTPNSSNQQSNCSPKLQNNRTSFKQN